MCIYECRILSGNFVLQIVSVRIVEIMLVKCIAKLHILSGNMTLSDRTRQFSTDLDHPRIISYC